MVNAVIGDAGFKHYYHLSPTIFSSLLSLFAPLLSLFFEDFRIKAHLRFVHATLANPRSKKSEKKEREDNRKRGLQALEEYANTGIFPRNYDCSRRIPAFVDREGRLCAVAYIMDSTGNEKLVNSINNRFHNKYIYDMKNYVPLQEWIARSGFTIDELAMIQPGYPPFHYAFSTLFYVAMCLFLGISASIQYSNSTSSVPHYESILLGLSINNFIGFAFSLSICWVASISKPFLGASFLLLRLLWCAVNFGLLSYYIANVRQHDTIPYSSTRLIIAGLVLTTVCFVVSLGCDACGILIQTSLNDAQKRRKQRHAKEKAERIQEKKGEYKEEYEKEQEERKEYDK